MYILTDEQVEMIKRELDFIPQKAAESRSEIAKEQFQISLARFYDSYTNTFMKSTIEYIRNNEEEIQKAIEPTLYSLINDANNTIGAMQLSCEMNLVNMARKMQMDNY